jgi:glycosyltransferase involved in cell wall biosynthesis
MRIVHYHAGIRLAQGGVVRAVLDLSAGLAARGHEVTLLTPDDTDAPADWRAGGPGLPRVVRTPPPGRLPGRLSSGLRAVAGPVIEAADVLHLHGMWIPANIGLARLAVRGGVPYVHSLHGMLDDWSMSIRPTKKAVFMAMHGRRLLREAAAVHCCAEGELRQAAPRLPRPTGEVIPLLMDLAAYRELPEPAEPVEPPAPPAPGAPATDRPPRLAFLSRLHPVKGLEVLMDAVARLADRRPELELHVAGSGDPDYERSLHERADRLGLGDRCRFLGFTGGADKLRLLADADLFVVPTLHENFGFVLLESLAAGTPVLTTREANTSPEILAAGAGRVTERTAEAMATAIDAMLADPDELRAMGRRGRAWVLEAFGGDRGVTRFEELYARVQPDT